MKLHKSPCLHTRARKIAGKCHQADSNMAEVPDIKWVSVMSDISVHATLNFRLVKLYFTSDSFFESGWNWESKGSRRSHSLCLHSFAELHWICKFNYQGSFRCHCAWLERDNWWHGCGMHKRRGRNGSVSRRSNGIPWCHLSLPSLSLVHVNAPITPTFGAKWPKLLRHLQQEINHFGNAWLRLSNFQGLPQMPHSLISAPVTSNYSESFRNDDSGMMNLHFFIVWAGLAIVSVRHETVSRGALCEATTMARQHWMWVNWPINTTYIP